MGEMRNSYIFLVKKTLKRSCLVDPVINAMHFNVGYECGLDSSGSG
jgi:hypothetical protein